VAKSPAPRQQAIRYDQRGTGIPTVQEGRFWAGRSRGRPQSNPNGLRPQAVELARAYLGRYPGPVLARRVRSGSRSCSCGKLRDRVGRGLEGDGAGGDGPQRQTGNGGFALMGLYQLISMLPGRLGDRGARRLIALVWRNYVDPPSSAPPPEKSWLDGLRSKPMLETRRAAVEAGASRLNEIPLISGAQVLVLFVSQYIYRPTVERLFAPIRRQPRGAGERGTLTEASEPRRVSCRAMRVLRLSKLRCWRLEKPRADRG
jgi:hypothetical protein